MKGAKHMGANQIAQLLGVYPINDAPDVHLFELLIHATPKDVNVSAFTQKDESLPQDSWQVAYNEHFLNEDGTNIIGTFLDQNRLTGTETRLVFFLYFVDFNKPLSSQYGDLVLPTPSSMPERLAKIIEFEPVD